MARKDTQGKVVRHVLHRGKIIPYAKLPVADRELAPVATVDDDDDKADAVDAGTGDNTEAFSVGSVATRQPGERAVVQPTGAAPVTEIPGASAGAPGSEQAAAPATDPATPPVTPPADETGAPAPGNEAATRAEGEQDAAAPGEATTPAAPAEAPAASPVTEQVAAEQPVTTPAVETPAPAPAAAARRGRGRPPRNPA